MRADCERVVIGADTNIQDMAMCHVDPGKTPPLPCVSTASAAKTPPLPCVTTASAAKTPPLPCVFPPGPKASAELTALTAPLSLTLFVAIRVCGRRTRACDGSGTTRNGCESQP